VPKRGERTDGQCVYCGVVGPITRDHVPPENLFPEPRPTNLITVPACEACNNGFKLDDEYFRLAIMTGIDGDALPRELDHSIKAIKKLADPRKRLFAKKMLKAYRVVEVKSPAGLFLGQAGGLTVDGDRILRTVRRIVRGLFFHHAHRRLPPQNDVRAFYVANRRFLEDADVAAIVNTMCAPQILGNRVLAYRYSLTEGDDSGSAWLLQFFGGHTFLVLTDLSENEARA
jgi:hypothetical protein